MKQPLQLLSGFTPLHCVSFDRQSDKRASPSGRMAFAIHLIDLSESKSRNQLTFSNAYDIHGRGEQIVEAHQILKNRQKRQKSCLLQSLSTENVTKVPQMSLALLVLQKCVSVKRSNSNILNKDHQTPILERNTTCGKR